VAVIATAVAALDERGESTDPPAYDAGLDDGRRKR
jgi:hypothetical protein